MATSRVIVEDNFRKLGTQYERAIQRSLGQAAAATVAKARNPSTNYNIGSITEKTTATRAHRIRKGWRIFVYDPDFRAIFFEKGTYSRRRSRLSPRYQRTPKAAATAAKPGTGVKAQHMLSRAATVARLLLLEALRRQMR